MSLPAHTSTSPACHTICRLLLCLAALLTPALAQSGPFSVDSTQPAPASAASPFLRRGTNEFGAWSGYSPFSFVLKGTSKDRQVFLRPGRSLTFGWKYHHLSNDYQAHLNPGIDSGVFFVGFSVFKAKHE